MAYGIVGLNRLRRLLKGEPTDLTSPYGGMENHRNTVVLLVEDEPIVRMFAMEGLEAEGFEVEAVGDAAQALKCLEGREDIKVLFTDVNMPGAMDGLGLAQLVRKRWPMIDIIVTSGKQRPAQGELPDGAWFVPKPYDLGKVAGIVTGLGGPQVAASIGEFGAVPRAMFAFSGFTKPPVGFLA